MNAHRAYIFCTVAAALVALAPMAFSQSPPAGKVPEGLSGSDWSGIRAAYEAGRHQAVAVEGGYRARNPGQQWATCFDGRGFSTEPDGGGWSWGLALESYGFDGDLRAVEEPVEMRAEGPRVAYAWEYLLEEWYQNDRRGLEHGYTVRERPVSDQDGPLTFHLSVRGALRPEVQADGRGVRFVNADGAAVVTYTGLTVLDAHGRELPAHFDVTEAGLRLTVDARDARYPLTIDPVAQQAYLKASNTDSGDQFGNSVSISGDTVVVGAHGEDGNAGGSGAAYVFVRNGTSWSQQAYLKASNADALDFFGEHVSLSGDTLVVGASFEDSAATGVDGDQNDNSAGSSGAAYVFVRNGTSWSQQAYLKASNTGAGDQFGESVAVSGDTVVVGAWVEDSNATGVDGNQSDNSASGSGAAYVFVRSGTSWSQQAYLKASNTAGSDQFGWSVSVSGDTLVVGANGEDSNATGVNGDQSDNGAAAAGAAYVFVRNGTIWSQQAYLKASNTDGGDQFGWSVSVSGDTIVVGANGEDSNAAGVNGDQSDNSAAAAGAAYVFVRSGTIWSQQAYLKASNIDSSDQFGWSASVSGDTVVVGALAEDSNATGVDGNQSDNSASGAGAAYVFVRNGTSWSQQAYLKASNTGANDQFGWSVSVSVDAVVVGAPLEDSNTTGVDGNQSDNSASGAGAAYVFDLDPPDPWTDLGFALAGTHGEPVFAGAGSLEAGASITLSLANAKENALAGLILGTSAILQPFKGGTLVPNLDLLVLLATDAAGEISLQTTPAGSPPPGTTLFAQYWIQDSAGPLGFAASNALSQTAP